MKRIIAAIAFVSLFASCEKADSYSGKHILQVGNYTDETYQVAVFIDGEQTAAGFIHANTSATATCGNIVDAVGVDNIFVSTLLSGGSHDIEVRDQLSDHIFYSGTFDIEPDQCTELWLSLN